jgi:hypothetical protein
MEEKSENISIPLSYTFSFINVLLIIYTQICLKSKNNQERLLKFRIFLLIVCDSFSIIFELIYKNYLNEVFYELLATFSYSLQFFIFISFIIETLINCYKIDEKEIINSYMLGFICYLIIYPYYKFLYFHRIAVLVIQYIGTSIGILCLNYYIRNLLRNISENKYKKPEIINKTISNLNNICLSLFLSFNVLNLVKIFFNNINCELVIFYSYYIIKYIIFILLIRIVSIINTSKLCNASNGIKIDISNIE